MSEVGVLFNCRSNYTFLNDKDLGIKINHKFVFALGEPRKKLNIFKNFKSRIDNEVVNTISNSSLEDTLCNAVVCRVQVFNFLFINIFNFCLLNIYKIIYFSIIGAF